MQIHSLHCRWRHPNKENKKGKRRNRNNTENYKNNRIKFLIIFWIQIFCYRNTIWLKLRRSKKIKIIKDLLNHCWKHCSSRSLVQRKTKGKKILRKCKKMKIKMRWIGKSSIGRRLFIRIQMISHAFMIHWR